jgi:protein-L-isoaspartate O-methyltransferase
MRTFRSIFALSLIFIWCEPARAQANAPLEEVPYVPTPIEVVNRMLELGDMKKSDILYDLGSGDGRIVIQAAKKYGAKAVGIEYDAKLVDQARAEAKKEGVEHLVEFRHQDVFNADISAATVVTIYMLPSFNARLRPVLEKQLEPGTRVVAHDYPVEGWKPAKWEEMPLRDTRPSVAPHNHILYLYNWMPEKK